MNKALGGLIALFGCATFAFGAGTIHYGRIDPDACRKRKDELEGALVLITGFAMFGLGVKEAITKQFSIKIYFVTLMTALMAIFQIIKGSLRVSDKTDIQDKTEKAFRQGTGGLQIALGIVMIGISLNMLFSLLSGQIGELSTVVRFDQQAMQGAQAATRYAANPYQMMH